MVELVLQAANKHLEDRPELQGRLAGYRGGYQALERRKLERRLFTGDLLCDSAMWTILSRWTMNSSINHQNIYHNEQIYIYKHAWPEPIESIPCACPP